MNQKIILLLSIIVILVVGGIVAFQFIGEGYVEQKGFYMPSQPFEYGVAVQEDYDNFELILSKNPMIQDLPDDAILFMSFYNYYSGERQEEKNYILTKGIVKEGIINEYDLKLIMHSKYLTVLAQNNFCQVVQTAKADGNFGTQTTMSTTSLLWKFKSMTGYKDCLGF